METKGDSILSMYIADTTFSSRDLIVGDTDGNVIIFSNNEILSRKKLMYSITALAPDKDLRNQLIPCGLPQSQNLIVILIHIVTSERIVAGDAGGSVCSFQSHVDFWNMRMCDGAYDTSLSSETQKVMRIIIIFKYNDNFGFYEKCDMNMGFPILLSSVLIIV